MAREDILRRHRDVEIIFPNRGTPESELARKATAGLLTLVGVMMLIVAIGGWGTLTGAKPVLIFLITICFTMAFFVMRWNRGVLPVTAGTAVILIIFALVAGPDWFSRTNVGFNESALPDALLGFVTLALIPVCMLLTFVSLWGFMQEWNIEEEVPRTPGAAPMTNAEARIAAAAAAK